MWLFHLVCSTTAVQALWQLLAQYMLPSRAGDQAVLHNTQHYISYAPTSNALLPGHDPCHCLRLASKRRKQGARKAQAISSRHRLFMQHSRRFNHSAYQCQRSGAGRRWRRPHVARGAPG